MLPFWGHLDWIYCFLPDNCWSFPNPQRPRWWFGKRRKLTLGKWSRLRIFHGWLPRPNSREYKGGSNRGLSLSPHDSISGMSSINLRWFWKFMNDPVTFHTFPRDVVSQDMSWSFDIFLHIIWQYMTSSWFMISSHHIAWDDMVLSQNRGTSQSSILIYFNGIVDYKPSNIIQLLGTPMFEKPHTFDVPAIEVTMPELRASPPTEIWVLLRQGRSPAARGMCSSQGARGKIGGFMVLQPWWAWNSWSVLKLGSRVGNVTWNTPIQIYWSWVSMKGLSKDNRNCKGSHGFPANFPNQLRCLELDTKSGDGGQECSSAALSSRNLENVCFCRKYHQEQSFQEALKWMQICRK